MMFKRFHQPPPAGLENEAFLALYCERWADLLAFFVKRTLAPEAAADLTAETFAKAFVRRGQFDPHRGDPAGWLYGIAKNELGSYLRTLSVERKARDQLDLPRRSLTSTDYERIEELIDFAEVGRGVQSALGDLAPEQRVAVVYRVIDGLSYLEIADRVGCSQEAARARVSRGLRTLARALTPQDSTQQGES
jgi:RNA polymerase sigma-70 factor, ECF subfamily